MDIYMEHRAQNPVGKAKTTCCINDVYLCLTCIYCKLGNSIWTVPPYNAVQMELN